MDSMMAGNHALFFISAFTLVSAFQVDHGCVVQNELDLTMKGLAINLFVKKANSTVPANISFFENTMNNHSFAYFWYAPPLESSRWTPISLSVYPSFEITMNGNFTVKRKWNTNVPPRLLIEDALVLTHNCQDLPIYQLTRESGNIEMTLINGDEIMFLSTINAKRLLHLKLLQRLYPIEWTGGDIKLKNAYNLSNPFSLKINLSKDNIKITWGNRHNLKVNWIDGYKEKVTVKVRMIEGHEPVYMSTPELKRIMPIVPPTIDPTKMLKDSEDCEGFIAALTVFVILLILCFIIMFIVLYPKVNTFCTCLPALPGTENNHNCGVVRGESEERPVVPPRPDNEQPGAVVKKSIKVNDTGLRPVNPPTHSDPYIPNPVAVRREAVEDNDDGYDDDNPGYVTANDVKPFQVLFLEKDFKGKVEFTNNPRNIANDSNLPSSTVDSAISPNMDYQYPYEYDYANSNYDTEPFYMNLPEVQSQACQEEEEDLYLSISPNVKGK